MNAIKSYQNKMKDRFVDNLSSMFPNSDKRIRVWAEIDKYKWKEDDDVWKQKKGITAPQYEVHFDGEFVCFIDSQKTEKYNLSEFLINIRKLYRDGKIFVNVEMYEVKKAEAEAKNKVSDLIIPKAENEAEAMIVETIKKQAKKRGRKVISK